MENEAKSVTGALDGWIDRWMINEANMIEVDLLGLQTKA